MDHQEEKKTPTWVWVALGCSIPVVIMIVVIVGVGLFGYRMAKQIKDDTPEQRAERVKETLGCEEIPEGYYPALTLSWVPWVILSAVVMLWGLGPVKALLNAGPSAAAQYWTSGKAPAPHPILSPSLRGFTLRTLRP